MNVRLTPDMRRLLEKELATGLYVSASDVIREALRQLAAERRWCEEAHRKVALGMAEAGSGRLAFGTEVAKRLRRRLVESRSGRR